MKNTEVLKKGTLARFYFASSKYDLNTRKGNENARRNLLQLINQERVDWDKLDEAFEAYLDTAKLQYQELKQNSQKGQKNPDQ